MDIRKLTEKLFQRDLEDFNFDSMVNQAFPAAATRQMPEYAELLSDILKDVGPAVFEAGYFAGASAGFEVLREMRRANPAFKYFCNEHGYAWNDETQGCPSCEHGEENVKITD